MASRWLAAVAVAWEVLAARGVGEADSGTEASDEACALQRTADRRVQPDRRASEARDSCKALGMFSIDGYVWPSQPGDPNDKRTWCNVHGIDPPNYTCILPEPGNFDLIPVTVPNLTWYEVQAGKWNSSINEQWTLAVLDALSDPCIVGMMGNAGFFSFFQDNVNDVMNTVVSKSDGALSMKPWLGGAPALAPVLGSEDDGLPIAKWDILSDPNDMAMILTSDSPDISGLDLMRLLHNLGIDNRTTYVDTANDVLRALNSAVRVMTPYDALLQLRFILSVHQTVGFNYTKVNAGKFRVVGVQSLPHVGWAIVDGGAFYNAKLGKPYVLEAVKNVTKELEAAGKVLRVILIECTELPVFANSLRMEVKVPVWDAHTVGVCLVAAAPTYGSNPEASEEADLDPDESNSLYVYNNAAFHDCMMSWFTPDKLSKKFGEDNEGKFKYYDTNGYTDAEIDQLMCTGGRPKGKPPLGRRISDFEAGRTGIGFTDACSVMPTCGGDNTPTCSTPCPAGGLCGEQVPTAPCGIHGDECLVMHGHANESS